MAAHVIARSVTYIVRAVMVVRAIAVIMTRVPAVILTTVAFNAVAVVTVLIPFYYSIAAHARFSLRSSIYIPLNILTCILIRHVENNKTRTG